MQHRTYGKNGPEISVLGFGAMRLPARKKGVWGSVNFSKAVPLIRRALEGGVNLIDSHHGYHGGLSEETIGRALKGWRGHRVYIQTKTPFYDEQPQSYFKALIEQALEKTGAECIDYLLFHSMRMSTWEKRGKKFLALTDWAIRKGYVRHRGFSSHDSPENVRAFVDTGEFSSMVVSFHFRNRQMLDTLAYAADKGMGVCVMNPVGGGALAVETPQILRLLRGAKTSAEVALRFAMSTPGVTTALSGMSTIEQVDENVAVASRAQIMTDRQRADMLARLARLDEIAAETCTACGYCMPCPHGVDIPGNFRLLNQARQYGLAEASQRGFARLAGAEAGDQSARACKQCGRCLPKCPNDVPIIEQLDTTAAMLG